MENISNGLGLTPAFFDALVLIAAAIGLVLAAQRIRRDLSGPPRWSGDLPETLIMDDEVKGS